mmetsp:Transcript_13747/g.23440  ORF Transcript_13747/g.23440 Transcript_13747/m.23440 type:complete len:93 (+) Transcript_13747:423-701(+)
MQSFDKIFHSNFWGALFHRFTNEEKNAALVEDVKKLEAFFVENLAGKDYLSGGDQPNIFDVHCFPMIEKIVMLENSEWHIGFEKAAVKENAP